MMMMMIIIIIQKKTTMTVEYRGGKPITNILFIYKSNCCIYYCYVQNLASQGFLFNVYFYTNKEEDRRGEHPFDLVDTFEGKSYARRSLDTFPHGNHEGEKKPLLKTTSISHRTYLVAH